MTERVVYVVSLECHTDDYKRGETTSIVRSVHTDQRKALLTSISKMLTSASEYSDRTAFRDSSNEDLPKTSTVVYEFIERWLAVFFPSNDNDEEVNDNEENTEKEKDNEVNDEENNDDNDEENTEDEEETDEDEVTTNKEEGVEGWNDELEDLYQKWTFGLWLWRRPTSQYRCILKDLYHLQLQELIELQDFLVEAQTGGCGEFSMQPSYQIYRVTEIPVDSGTACNPSSSI